MAYIIKIKTATKLGMNVDDVVSIQDVRPSEKEYSIFTVEEVKGSAKDMIDKRDAALPVRRSSWYDESVGEWKEIAQEPRFVTKYLDGEFVHNYGSVENSTSLATVSATTISAKTKEAAAK